MILPSFSLCITQQTFTSYQHHTTQRYHGISQRNKQVEFLVTSANSPSTLSNIFSSVLGLFPRFGNRQGNTNKHKNEDQKQSATEASNIEPMCTTYSSKGTNLSTSIDTIQEVDVSDPSMDICIHQDARETPAVHGSLFQNSTHTELITIEL